MLIPLEISSSLTRNPSEKWLFRQELPAHGRGIHRRNGIPLGITSSWNRNPTEEGDSAGNNQLLMLIQTGKLKMRGKSSEL
jgi:hypothetical protein